MIVMGPPQQGHGNDISLAAVAGASSVGWSAVAMAPLRRAEWIVYAKRPFAGPKVLAYLSRYTHGIAISNRRLVCSTRPTSV